MPYMGKRAAGGHHEDYRAQDLPSDIRSLRGRADLTIFLSLPQQFYHKNPHWIEPLRFWSAASLRGGETRCSSTLIDKAGLPGVGHSRWGRIPLMGVRKRHQYSRLELALARELIAVRQDRSIAKGFQGVKLSWILEDNAGMRYILENLGAELYQRSRLYQKSLAEN